jgi:hypothetical protein
MWPWKANLVQQTNVSGWLLQTLSGNLGCIADVQLWCMWGNIAGSCNLPRPMLLYVQTPLNTHRTDNTEHTPYRNHWTQTVQTTLNTHRTHTTKHTAHTPLNPKYHWTVPNYIFMSHIAVGRIETMNNPSDSIGNWPRNLPACSAVPQQCHSAHMWSCRGKNHFCIRGWALICSKFAYTDLCFSVPSSVLLSGSAC